MDPQDGNEGSPKVPLVSTTSRDPPSLEDHLLDRLIERLTIRLDESVKLPSQSAPKVNGFNGTGAALSRHEDLQEAGRAKPAKSDRGSQETVEAEVPSLPDEYALDSDEELEMNMKPIWLIDEHGKRAFLSANRVVGVRETGYKDFMNRFSGNEPLHTIDVLAAGPEFPQECAREEFERDVGGFKRRWATHDAQRFSTLPQSWIRRIRVQSNVLLSILSRVTGYCWRDAPLTFIQPFTYFLHYYNDLKKELERMEVEAKDDMTSPEAAPSVPDHAEPSGLADATEKRKVQFPVPDKENPSTPMCTQNIPSPLDELRCFVEFLDGRILPEYNIFQHKGAVVRFDQLSSLFRIGDLVYLRPVRQFRDSELWHSIGRVCYVHDPPPPVAQLPEEGVAFTLHFYIVDFNGFCYVAAPREYKIYSFNNYMFVRDLDVYPLRLSAFPTETLQEACDLGRKFIQCISSAHATYSGTSLVTNPFGQPIKSQNGRNMRARHIEGDVIVDFKEAFTTEPSYYSFGTRDVQLLDAHYGLSEGGVGDHLTTTDAVVTWSDANRSKRLWSIRETVALPLDVQLAQRDCFALSDRYLLKHRQSAEEPCEEDLALLPGRVFGYSIRELAFFALDVRHCTIVTPQADSFNDLQLPGGQKQQIIAAVEGHLWRRKWQGSIRKRGGEPVRTQDLIPGKGTGTTILLHGEPGVGKTATAEAIAHLTGRPLLPVNCGFLSPALLDSILHLAHLWDCIVLFDEADVFLTARSPSRPWADNSRVSDFLRKLEYHNGLLFLTTNRIGKIDPAISSRMTLILRYKRLQPEAIERIFQANIKRLREAENQLHEVSGEPPIFIMERDLMRFAADHCAKHPNGKGAWNGREIRNAFVMAASLARHDATGTDDPAFQPQLRYNHFQEVEVLTEEYNRFRVQLFGGDDSRRALLSEERNDEFENEEEREEVKRAATISQLDFARMVYASSSQTAREPFPDMRAAAQASAGLKVFSQVPRPSPPWTGASTGPSAFGRHATMQGGPEADSTEQSHFSSQGGAR